MKKASAQSRAADPRCDGRLVEVEEEIVDQIFRRNGMEFKPGRRSSLGS